MGAGPARQGQGGGCPAVAGRGRGQPGAPCGSEAFVCLGGRGGHWTRISELAVCVCVKGGGRAAAAAGWGGGGGGCENQQVRCVCGTSGVITVLPLFR